MVSRYHWLIGGGNSSWSGQTVLPAANLVIPAGATLKRFIICNSAMTGKNTGTQSDILQPVYCSIEISITTGPYAGRIIYTSSRALTIYPLSTMVTEVGIGLRVYTQIVNAGDNELGVNQKCSYGKASGASFNVKAQLGIFPRGTTPSLSSGLTQYNIKLLYYL